MLCGWEGNRRPGGSNGSLPPGGRRCRWHRCDTASKHTCRSPFHSSCRQIRPDSQSCELSTSRQLPPFWQVVPKQQHHCLLLQGSVIGHVSYMDLTNSFCHFTPCGKVLRSASVCLFVHLSVHFHISKTTSPNFTKFSVHVTRYPYSPTTITYIMFFWFCGWRHVLT